MIEEWNLVKETGRHKVSNFGRLKSLVCKKHKIIQGSRNNNGYKELMYWENGKRKRVYVHKLVAKYFLGDSKLDVNHIDENKLNNRLDNLEYVTHKQNLRKYFSSILTKGNSSLKSTSKFLGVHKVKSGNFAAQITINGKTNHLGTFKTEEEASKVYQDKLKGVMNGT